MKLLDWRKFFIMDDPFFNKLPDTIEKMLKESAPHLHKIIWDDNPCCGIGLCNLLSSEFLMAIGAKICPIEESKLIFEYLLLQQNEKNPERYLLDLLGKMLNHVEHQVMSMEESERKNYICQGKFVEQCLVEIPSETLFTPNAKIQNSWFK